MADEKINRRDFIKKGVVIGFGITGLGVLNACGANAGDLKSKKITSVSTMKNNEIMNFTYKNEKGILVKFNDKFYAYKNKCTHKGGPVDKFSNNEIVCKWHDAKFEPATGKHLSGPGQGMLEKINIKIKDGAVWLA